MALRPVRGVLVIEGVQTGDGRFIQPGALSWAPLPLPIASLDRGDQHLDLLTSAPQIGNFDTVTRAADGRIEFTGVVDDEIPEGAELIRRLEAGSAAHGTQQFVSIDPDNWAMEWVDTEGETTDDEGGAIDSDEYTVLASVSGVGPLPALTAAAGDTAADGVVLFEDRSDLMIQRFTRLRIRGVTACQVSAFDGAYIELAGAAEEAPVEEEPAEGTEEEQEASVVASRTGIQAAATDAPVQPPAEWFRMPEPDIDDERMVEQYDRAGNPIGFAVPLTITDEGQVYGHVAASWGQCHVGYDSCVNPPPSMTNYAHFHVGEVVTAEGERIATGSLTVGCDHAAATMLAPMARDHYANVGLSWADVRCVDGEQAPWICGALRPGLDDATIRVLRATVMSGDWRRMGTSLELIAIQSVNNPGFPVGREALAASALPMLASPTPETHVENGIQTALVAATPATRCVQCQERLMRDNLVAPTDGFARLERKLLHRTAHLIPAARDAVLEQIRSK